MPGSNFPSIAKTNHTLGTISRNRLEWPIKLIDVGISLMMSSALPVPRNRPNANLYRQAGARASACDGECPRMTSKYFKERAVACRQTADDAGDHQRSPALRELALMFEQMAEDTRIRRLVSLAEAAALETGITVVLHTHGRAILLSAGHPRNQPSGRHTLIDRIKWPALVSWVGSVISQAQPRWD
jgi:hypothetical protein